MSSTMDMEIDDCQAKSKRKQPEPEKKEPEIAKSSTTKPEPRQPESSNAKSLDVWLLSRIANVVSEDGELSDSQLQILVVGLAQWAGVDPKNVKASFIKYCCEQYRKEPLYGMKGSISSTYNEIIDKSKGIYYFFLLFV